MRADDFGWLVGGFFTIVLPWYFKNKKQNEETKRKMKADRKFWVTLEEGLLEELRKLLGEKNVAVKNGKEANDERR
mgnify:CR=1 FL=1